MKWGMHENSLFAILLRASWWVSALVGSGTYLVLRLFLPPDIAIFAAVPFLVISVVAGWRQLRQPRGAKIDAALERLRAMAWKEFAAALEAGFARDGYAVAPHKGGRDGAADFALEKGGHTVLVAAKRWKASQTGIDPLRELRAAADAAKADDCLYVFAGGITDTARAYAREHRIQLVEGAELARIAAP